jgi:antitoxin component of MazEF toxin-antitoxin module
LELRVFELTKALELEKSKNIELKSTNNRLIARLPIKRRIIYQNLSPSSAQHQTKFYALKCM